MSKFIDITGQTFGRLTAIESAGWNAEHRILWRCSCVCGKETITSGHFLRRGHTQSCGCLKLDRTVQSNSTHRATHSRLYRIWSGMKGRCENPHKTQFSYYGGRGLRVCDEWQHFEPFRDWSLTHGYNDNLTLDRIDNDGHYEPSNCRWIPQAEQSRNRRYCRR